jgi:hypothetical protein
MTDILRVEIKLEFTSGVEPWALVRELLAELSKLADRHSLNGTYFSYSGSSPDNKSFERRTLDGLKAAFEKNHALPTRINTALYADGRGLNPVDNISLWGRFWDQFETSHVVLTVDGADRLATERFATELCEALEASVSVQRLAPALRVDQSETRLYSRDDDTDDEVTEDVSESAPSPSVRAAPAALAPVAASEHERTIGFIRRTWRDHTAVFIVTLAAGFILLVAASVLGLNA